MRILIAIVLLVLMAAGNMAARAHAFLDHASPLVGSTVQSPPREVSLTFTQNIEPAFSTVSVFDANGARVDQGKPQIGANTMRVGLKSLAPGSYKVRWHVISVDTHSTQGTFSFTVSGH
jgi:copper resistance protein C